MTFSNKPAPPRGVMQPMDMTNIVVPHPGEFIKEELDARGWSQRDLAYILGCPEQAVNLIVAGRRGISAEMAKAMGDAFDVPGEFFANLQKMYDLSQARHCSLPSDLGFLFGAKL